MPAGKQKATAQIDCGDARIQFSGAIVVGHIAAVVLAHRRALQDSPSRPILAGLPLVLLMVGYTVLSLWIIAQPITLEPGSTQAALLAR